MTDNEHENNHKSDTPVSKDQIDDSAPQSELQQAGSDAGDNSSDSTNDSTNTALTPWDQIRQQYSLPPEEFALMVQTSNWPPDREQVVLAKRVVGTFGIPVTGFNIIRTRVKGGYKNNVYINSYGINFRLHMDKRGFLFSTGKITHMPSDEEPWIAAYGKAEMQNGAWADNESYKEWPITDSEDKDRGFSLGNLCKKLITQAKRRAGADLVGVGLPVYDEYYDQAYSQVMEGEFKEIRQPSLPPKEAPDTLPELLAMAQQKYNLNMASLVKLMGVTTISDLNIEETWDKIRKTWDKIRSMNDGASDEEQPQGTGIPEGNS